MLILGIETSCDECSIAVVRDGKEILSNVIATQIEEHIPYYGVVPEIASRLHTEWIIDVYTEALQKAGIQQHDLDAIAVTSEPGLVGSLLVGVCFAKGLAAALDIPLIGVNHILAHLYAPTLEMDVVYPFLGILVSGGHSVICKVAGYNDVEVLGTTIDDAIGEAFDKVAKFYNFGYPGGPAIDKLAQAGDDRMFHFPIASLHKGNHTYDVSYSGLKTAVINQLDFFRRDGATQEEADKPEHIAASFQRIAVETMMRKVRKAVEDTGLSTIVAGGGVAANSRFRSELLAIPNTTALFPSLKLCTDNGAMIAGIGYHYLQDGLVADATLQPSARIRAFQKKFINGGT